MALTLAQLQALKADIQANTDPAVVTGLANGDSGAIADWYNLRASPGYWIFRKVVSAKEVSDAINLQNVADITATNKDRVLAFFQIRQFDGGAFNGELTSDRTAFADAFSGANGVESSTAIAALWQREATNAEKVFALSTGTGADSANADTTTFQGTLSTADVTNSLNS